MASSGHNRSKSRLQYALTTFNIDKEESSLANSRRNCTNLSSHGNTARQPESQSGVRGRAVYGASASAAQVSVDKDNNNKNNNTTAGHHRRVVLENDSLQPVIGEDSHCNKKIDPQDVENYTHAARDESSQQQLAVASFDESDLGTRRRLRRRSSSAEENEDDYDFVIVLKARGSEEWQNVANNLYATSILDSVSGMGPEGRSKRRAEVLPRKYKREQGAAKPRNRVTERARAEPMGAHGGGPSHSSSSETVRQADITRKIHAILEKERLEKRNKVFRRPSQAKLQHLMGAPVTSSETEASRGASPPPKKTLTNISSDKYLRERPEMSVVDEIKKRIKLAGLKYKSVELLDGSQTVLKIKARYGRLEKAAEVLELSMKRTDGFWAPFRCSDRDLFLRTDANVKTLSPRRLLQKKYQTKLSGDVGVPASCSESSDDDDDGKFDGDVEKIHTDTHHQRRHGGNNGDIHPANLFRSSERQLLIYFILTSKEGQNGADLGETSLLSPCIEQMYPLHMVKKQTHLKEKWVKMVHRRRHKEYNQGSFFINSSNKMILAKPTNRKKRKRSIWFRPLCMLMEWKFPYTLLWQPIDEIKDYYGEHVAFYFAWLELYTRWLIVPSFAGLVLFLLQIYYLSLDQPGAIVYALLMALWASAFILAWKRRASELAYSWGVLDYEEEELTRPDFEGKLVRDALTKEWIIFYPSWRRNVKYIVSYSILLIWTSAVVLGMYYALRARDGLDDYNVALDLNIFKSEAIRDWHFWMSLILWPATYAIFIPVLDLIFARIARKMNNWENHATESKYQTHLIIKVFVFRAVHIFGSLYYYAFASSGNLLKVGTQLATFMIVGQISNNVFETLLPWLKRKYFHKQNVARQKANVDQLAHLSVARTQSASQAKSYHDDRGGVSLGGSMVAGVNEIMDASTTLAPPSPAPPGPQHGLWAPDARRSPLKSPQKSGGHSHDTFESINRTMRTLNSSDQLKRIKEDMSSVWEESRLGKYDTFEDYMEIMIQFGYVSFFSIAFPLAPSFALLNNVFEIRSDAFKLSEAKQRPLAFKSGGIGIWLNVLNLMSIIAVVTNCAHIAVTSRQISRAFPSLTDVDKVLLMVAAEHLILALKVWVSMVVHTKPKWVREARKREKSLALAAAAAQHRTSAKREAVGQ